MKWPLERAQLTLAFDYFWIFLCGMSKAFLIDLVKFPLWLFVFHYWLTREDLFWPYIQNAQHQSHIHCASWPVCHVKGLSIRGTFPKSIPLMLRTVTSYDSCTSGRRYKLSIDFQRQLQSDKNRKGCTPFFLLLSLPSSPLSLVGGLWVSAIVALAFLTNSFSFTFFSCCFFLVSFHCFFSFLFLTLALFFAFLFLISHLFHKRN